TPMRPCRRCGNRESLIGRAKHEPGFSRGGAPVSRLRAHSKKLTKRLSRTRRTLALWHWNRSYVSNWRNAHDDDQYQYDGDRVHHKERENHTVPQRARSWHTLAAEAHEP